MDFSLSFLKRGLLLAAMAFGVVLPLHAQYAGSRPGEDIRFSSPDTDDVVSNLPSLSPKPPGTLDFENAFEVPSTLNFAPSPNPAPLPSIGPVFSSEAAARVQDLLDRRNNWALLTPEEILGAATPEKIFGITDHNAFGQRKYSTALERYNERQNQMQLARTNGLSLVNSSPVWNSFSDRNSRSNSLYGGLVSPGALANPLFNSTADRQNENNGWSRLFDQPAPAPVPAPNPAQLTDMDRFRQLINPGLPSAAAAANPSAGGLKTSLPQTLLGSGLAQPPRMGASFAPLNSGISKAPEMPRLPSAWALSYTSPPPAEAWAPQLAPWLSPAPQPLAAPQRKF